MCECVISTKWFAAYVSVCFFLHRYIFRLGKFFSVWFWFHSANVSAERGRFIWTDAHTQRFYFCKKHLDLPSKSVWIIDMRCRVQTSVIHVFECLRFQFFSLCVCFVLSQLPSLVLFMMLSSFLYGSLSICNSMPYRVSIIIHRKNIHLICTHLNSSLIRYLTNGLCLFRQIQSEHVSSNDAYTDLCYIQMAVHGFFCKLYCTHFMILMWRNIYNELKIKTNGIWIKTFADS